MVRPDQSAGHVKLKNRQPLFCLFLPQTNTESFFVYVTLGVAARVNQVIFIFIA